MRSSGVAWRCMRPKAGPFSTIRATFRCGRAGVRPSPSLRCRKMRIEVMQGGFGVYTLRARIAPALLAAAPVLALGIFFLPLLPGFSKLYSIVAVAMTTYIALLARRAGHRAQLSLFASWGGAPTTSRL